MTVEEVMRRGFPSYHRPLELARAWLREGETRRADALALLTQLRKKYPHVLAIGNEFVLALLEKGDSGAALEELSRLERQFRDIDEETRSRWGRMYKETGDRAWQSN